MKNKFKLLYNPFDQIAGWKAFIIGIIIILLTVVIGNLNCAYYPGALDAKLAPDVPLSIAIQVQGIGLVSLVLIFYLAALIFAKGTRFQDILGTVTLSRFPYLFISLLGFLVDEDKLRAMNNAMMEGRIGDITSSVMDNVGMIVASLLMLPFIIWFIALLYNAFRVSTGLKGAKCVFLFIGAVIVAEVVSIVGISALL